MNKNRTAQEARPARALRLDGLGFKVQGLPGPPHPAPPRMYALESPSVDRNWLYQP